MAAVAANSAGLGTGCVGLGLGLGLDSKGAVVPQVPLTPMDTGPGALERACADFYN